MIGYLASAFLAISTTLPAPAATPPNGWLASQACTKAIVQQTPGHFLKAPADQLVEVDRGAGVVGGVPVCRFGISLVRAHDPRPSRYILGVGTDLGPGLVLREGVWRPDDWQVAYDVQVVRLQPFTRDQVLISETASHGGEQDTVVSLVSFTSDFPAPVTLLRVRDVGRLSLRVLADRIRITGFQQTGACTACGRMASIELQYDRAARGLALLDPTPANVQFYRQIHVSG
ncbi:MAG: hypothetical protein WA840_21340 [Caulobacteraceae bacterium]